MDQPEHKSEFQEALAFALKLLGMYARSTKEMGDKLADKHFDMNICAKVLAELERMGYLNDAEYARTWMRHQLENRPCGSMLCRKKLHEKGIPEEYINQAISEALPRERELDIARALAREKQASVTDLPREKQAQRVGQYLQGKGIGGEIIFEILHEMKLFT